MTGSLFFAKFATALLVLSLNVGTHAAECVVPHNENGTDDSPAILEAFTTCAEDSVITFQQKNYSAYTPMSWVNLKNVTINLQGNLLLPKNITAVQIAINETNNQPSTYATPWYYIHGEEVTFKGSNQSQWGAFHGFGQQWWDIENQTLRPQLATFNVTNGTLSGLKVIKPVAWGWNIPGKNVLVENHYVDAKPNNGTRNSTISFPFNTDGFNLSGQNITIDGYWGENGDDCVSVVSGARDITALNGYCGFSSHGLSIGSLGKNGANSTVANVLFNNWTMDGAVYGSRFKSWTGGNGWAENVTWSNIHLINVSTAIFITQNYFDQEVGKPTGAGANATKVVNFHYENFTGSLNGNWTDGTCSIILDLYNDTATNLTFTNISVSQHNGSNPNVLCDASALAPGEQSTLGFNCTDGPFKVTSVNSSSSTGGKSGSSGALSVRNDAVHVISIIVAPVMIAMLSMF
ncbi:pectin lyase-like protein [Punctularia strigosozonata HHB-11173 SS5]|uniref:pectin lyase-like protein n=1 Tax=Punctularia strigosozonata (strain HHB-11173) TaxID=741275 RepID=UPI0004417B1F|nr:pectin lyase-like protein [Punctularia strigosozonata HHB-11173 SS5]EIN08863.1 pectin lyase-like protein [Punctularia strigosozonata HHB-11173 SS5]